MSLVDSLLPNLAYYLVVSYLLAIGSSHVLFPSCFFHYLLSHVHFNLGLKGVLPECKQKPVEEVLKKFNTNERRRVKKEVHKDIPAEPQTKSMATAQDASTKQIKEEIALTPAQIDASIDAALSDTSIFPDEIPIKKAIGKSKLMEPQKPYGQEHPAIPLLHEYADSGCPVDCGPDWSKEQIELLLRRGPHTSATKPKAAAELRKETKEKVDQGYAKTVRWGDIKDSCPPKLKISPAAMIPHKSRSFRCILDLSFTFHHKGRAYPSVNATTNPQAKPEAMVQLGQCVKRLVAAMADTWTEETSKGNKPSPWKFAKLDIKDGFWRMLVSETDAWNFCYVLPAEKPLDSIDDIEIVVPTCLQMGWCESPPFFCAATETARDIIASLWQEATLPPHPMEQKMMSSAKDETQHTPPAEYVLQRLFEIYVDDFIGATNDLSINNLTRLSRGMLHGIHTIFPPPNVTGHCGFDPISESKLNKGEGQWAYSKEILGWVFDGQNFTITLPPEKCKKITNLIKRLLRKKRTSLQKFQEIAGKLQHASYGIPGGASLFTPIQMAMAKDPPFINITPELKTIFKDWKYMIKFLQKHPTHVCQLVPDYPKYTGHTDACGLGCGGTWTSGVKPLHPLVWQMEWPEDIKAKLITDSNPHGTITINDLELAAMVLGWLVLELQDVNLKFTHVGTYCDNKSAVAWAFKLRTSKSEIAGRLLRMLGMRIHARQASGLSPQYLEGEKNTWADVASRAFKGGKFFLENDTLTVYFNSNFPLPQQMSWQEFQVPIDLQSRVISCLRGEPLPMASLIRLPGLGQSTGTTGNNTPPSSNSTPSSATSRSHSSKKRWSSVHMEPELEQASTAEKSQFEFKESMTLSRPSPRPSNWLENVVPSTKRRKHTKPT